MRLIDNESFLALNVSTHAPIKDATKDNAISKQQYDVSTHAPIKDATKGQGHTTRDFGVSTHAPIKDATGVHFEFQQTY